MLTLFWPQFNISNIIMCTIVYKHWPDTCEFIRRTDELWNRWIRLSCYCMLLQQSIEHVSIVYTCSTSFVTHWSM